MGCVYRQPIPSRAFRSQLEYVTEPLIGHHLMLMGDFNVDLADIVSYPKDDPGIFSEGRWK